MLSIIEATLVVAPNIGRNGRRKWSQQMVAAGDDPTRSICVGSWRAATVIRGVPRPSFVACRDRHSWLSDYTHTQQ